MTAIGLLLLVIGVIVIVAEAHVPSLGLLGGPGVVALGVGAVLAVSGLGGGVVLAGVIALLLVGSGAGVVALSVRKGLAVRRRRIKTGVEGLIGHLGTVYSWNEPAGKVLVDGALWQATRSLADEDPERLDAGDRVIVERVGGLTLAVRRAEDWEVTP